MKTEKEIKDEINRLMQNIDKFEQLGMANHSNFLYNRLITLQWVLGIAGGYEE